MADKDLVSQLKEHRLQAVVVMLAGDEGVAGVILDTDDDILTLNNFAGTKTYVVIEKITALRFYCNPVTSFTATVTVPNNPPPLANPNVNLGFEERVNGHLEVYRRLFLGTATGALAGPVGIVQNASVNAANINIQTGYQSATITLTQAPGFFGNHLLVSFAGLISLATTPNVSGVFHIIRGVGNYAGALGGGTLVGTFAVDGTLTGLLTGVICPATIVAQ